mgnify:CR=1 FL=1
MKVIRKPLFAVIIYLLVQAAFTLLAGLIANPITPVLLFFSLLLSGAITTYALYKLHMIHESTIHPWRISWRYVHLGVISVMLGIFAADLISANYLQLPDLMKMQFTEMAESKWGVLAIVFVAPLTEELVFREGVLGYMIRHDANKWVSIFFSALLFGLAHFNPAQIPFAFFAGFLLGGLADSGWLGLVGGFLSWRRWAERSKDLDEQIRRALVRMHNVMDEMTSWRKAVQTAYDGLDDLVSAVEKF